MDRYRSRTNLKDRECDDLEIVADIKDEIQRIIARWNNTSRRHGLLVNLAKTETMWMNEEKDDLHVVVDGKTIKQVNTDCILGLYSMCGGKA